MYACHGAKGPPGNQIGYSIKLFAPHNLFIRAVSKIITVNLSNTETEVLWAVAAVRDMIDSCFLLNFRIPTLSNSLLKAKTYHLKPCITVSPKSKQSHDEYVLWPMHTPPKLQSSNILTKTTQKSNSYNAETNY